MSPAYRVAYKAGYLYQLRHMGYQWRHMAKRSPRLIRAHAARWRAVLAAESLTVPPAPFRPAVRFDASGPRLLLSPHPDDAVLNCYSVLTSGAVVQIVNVFAGIPRPGFASKFDRACGAQESATHVRARLAEDEEVLAALGHRPSNLPFLDVQYGLRRLTRTALDRAAAQVVSTASVVYAPAALGYAHADHLFVRGYALALARAGIPVVLYADLPYAAALGWPAWVDGAARTGLPDRADAAWRAALTAVPQITGVEVVALGPDVAAAKLAAMRGYLTQFAMLDDGGLLSDPRTHGHEIYWSVGSNG